MGINKSYLKDKFLSTKGYKRNSPDVNNPYNVIPSNRITMKDVDFPVMGIDDMGNQQMMYPGNDYIYPGNYVTEFPLKNMGNKRFGQKGFYKPDFRTKSQIANAQGQQRENTYVKPVVKNAAQLQRINQIQEQERQRRIQKAADKVQGTLRETNDADREAMNREDYTLLGRAQKLGRGDFNPLVVAAGAADLINPAAYWYTGKDVARGIGQTAQGIVNLDPEQIGSGLLQTTLGGLTLLPATSGFKPALKQAGKYLTQTPLRNIFKGPFKSEINWGNWNAEIPKNKTLMREYKDIERTTKQAGTWMKNPDGTPFTLPDGTPGTAEQFVQMQSQNFKKAFPKGFDLTYRGGQVYNPMLGGSSKGWDNVDDIDPNFILFGTDNRSVAERYATNYGYGFDESFQAKGIHPSFYHPDVSKTIPYNTRMFGMNPLTDVGLYGYATPKNAQKLISNANKQRWMNVENSEVMEWLKRINPEEYKLRTLDKEWLPDKVTTDNIAKYIKEKNIPIAEIKNVHDGADYFGNFVPSNVRAINRSMINPKSLWYNSGMFDMTNPNIYKGVLPYALPIGAGLGTGYMMQNQKPKGTYQGGGTKGYKSDFRSKSQIAADYGATGETTKMTSKINPVSKRLIDEANYERLKSQQPSFNQGYKKTASDIERSDYYKKQQESKNALKNALRNVDVVTDVMQVGNFIPHPIAQGIGQLGNWLGAATDVTQAGMDYGNQNYGGMGINLASAIVPTALGAGSFRRSSKYLRPGQTLYPFSPQGLNPNLGINVPRTTYIEPFNMVKGMTKTNLMANRALLGTLGVETAYDAGAFDNNPRLGLPIKPINVNKPNYQGGGTNIDLKLPQFGEDKPRPFFEITGAGTGPQYDVFGYGYVPLGKNLGISADLMRWKEGDWRGGGYGISGNINIPINRGERKIRPTVKDPVMFQGGGTMGIPGVNGQVVSSGPTPLTSVKKTRGSMSMDNEGNIKTMPTKAVKKILKNIK